MLFLEFFYPEPRDGDGECDNDADDGYSDDIRNPQNVEFDKNPFLMSIFPSDGPARAV